MKKRLKWPNFAPKYGYFLKVPFLNTKTQISADGTNWMTIFDWMEIQVWGTATVTAQVGVRHHHKQVKIAIQIRGMISPMWSETYG